MKSFGILILIVDEIFEIFGDTCKYITWKNGNVKNHINELGKRIDYIFRNV